MSFPPRRLFKIAAILPIGSLLVGVAALVGLYLAEMFGGFDFTDEGNYYLSFVHPENVSDNQTSYFIFGGKLFSLLGHNIVAMRVCTLLATLGGTLVFLLGWQRFLIRFAPELRPNRERWWLMTGAALAGSFLGYAISPPALSYNFQNAFCLLAATGLLLGASAGPRTPGLLDRATLLALAGFGVLVAAQFFIKFSTSVPLAAGGSLFFLIVSPKSAAQKTALGAIFLACLATIAAVYFAFFQSFGHWWTGIFGTADALVHGHYASATIRRYGTEFTTLLESTLWDFVPAWEIVLASAVVVAALRGRSAWQRGVAIAAGLGILSTLIWIVTAEDRAIQDGPAFFLGSLILLAIVTAVSRLAVAGASQTGASGRWRLGLAGCFFSLLPYIGAFGTSNNINTNCLYQLAPWFVLAAQLLAEIDRVWQTAWPSRLALLLLAAVADGQFYFSYGVAPYRVAGGRALQTVRTQIGVPATTLRLSPETHEFIESARRALQDHGFKPGDDLLVLFDLPGLVFAMGGASPGHPWYFHGGPDSLDLDLMRLNFIDPARRQRAFIVRNGYLEDSGPLLRAAGLNFPEGYRLITLPMLSPFTQVPFEIWAPTATPLR